MLVGAGAAGVDVGVLAAGADVGVFAAGAGVGAATGSAAATAAERLEALGRTGCCTANADAGNPDAPISVRKARRQAVFAGSESLRLSHFAHAAPLAIEETMSSTVGALVAAVLTWILPSELVELVAAREGRAPFVQILDGQVVEGSSAVERRGFFGVAAAKRVELARRRGIESGGS